MSQAAGESWGRLGPVGSFWVVHRPRPQAPTPLAGLVQQILKAARAGLTRGLAEKRGTEPPDPGSTCGLVRRNEGRNRPTRGPLAALCGETRGGRGHSGCAPNRLTGSRVPEPAGATEPQTQAR